MVWKVQEAVLDDAEELGLVFREGFSVDPVQPLISRNVKKEVQVKGDTTWMHSEMTKPGARMFKLVDGSNGRIAAMASWYFPVHFTPEQIQKGEHVFKKSSESPEGTNLALSEDFMSKMNAARNKYIDRANMYFFNILSVRPEYQRQGLGTILLKHGLEFADKDQMTTYLEASKQGRDLYVRYGFKKMGQFEVDLHAYGVDAVEETLLMIRDPTPVGS